MITVVLRYDNSHMFMEVGKKEIYRFVFIDDMSIIVHHIKAILQGLGFKVILHYEY